MAALSCSRPATTIARRQAGACDVIKPAGCCEFEIIAAVSSGDASHCTACISKLLPQAAAAGAAASALLKQQPQLSLRLLLVVLHVKIEALVPVQQPGFFSSRGEKVRRATSNLRHFQHESRAGNRSLPGLYLSDFHWGVRVSTGD